MLHDILAHLEWADKRVHSSLEAAVTGDGLAAHEQAVRLYAHILGAEVIWVERIEGKPQSYPVWPAPDLEALGDVASDVHHRLRSAARTDQPDRVVSYRNTDGDAFQTPVSDILVHVCLHGAYHRGQVAHLLRSNGAEPASSDYIEFDRGAPAAKNESRN